MRGFRKSKLLLIDNFDSFTYTIKDYFEQLGMDVQSIQRSQCTPKSIEESDYIVISPSPGNPANMPDLKALIQLAVQKKPVLGICLGHQAIALHYGAEILQGKPMHGKISGVTKINHVDGLLDEIPEQFLVVRYHSLHVENLPPQLIPILLSKDKVLMAFIHAVKPIMGIQFHPEAHLSEFGMKLLRNWLDYCDH